MFIIKYFYNSVLHTRTCSSWDSAESTVRHLLNASHATGKAIIIANLYTGEIWQTANLTTGEYVEFPKGWLD